MVTYGDRGLPPFLADALSAESSASGGFAVGPVPEGKLGVSISAAGHAPRRLTAEVTAGQAFDLRDVVLEAGLAIRGRVRDAEGNGVGGALVTAQKERSAEPDETENKSETEADGSFVLAGLDAGGYSLSASASGFARTQRRTEAGGEPVEIVLQQGGSIVGRVADSNGAPIDGATVLVESATQGPGGGRFYSAGSGGAEGDGRFVVRDAPEDTYGLRIRASGYGEATRANVKVVAGRDTDLGTVALAAGGSVVGTVVDTNGEGVPGVAIRVERDTNIHTGDLTAQTGLDGAFEVRGVPPGRVEVNATHPAYVGRRVRGVEVDPAKEPAPVRVVLTRGGRIEGRARHRDGSPFEGGRLQIWGRGGATLPGFELQPTAADGSFAFEHVPTGTVTVNLMTFVPQHPLAGGGPGVTVLGGVAKREAEVREGETTSLEIVTREVVVAGRVTRGGRGMAGVRVSVMTPESMSAISMMGPNAPRATGPQQGPPPLSATTREDGSYELLVFGPGKGRVNLVSESPRQSHPMREVEVPDAERFELDVELGESTIAGIVVDAETGSPIAEATVALRAAGTEGQARRFASVSPDGRFALGADAGDYVLEANAQGRKTATLPLTVSAAGVSDLRLELEQGLEITGRLLDPTGRPALGVNVVASDPEQPRTRGAYANTQPDGGFRLGGLESKTYVVAGGSELSGFAIRTGVTPGGEPLVLRMRPGGRVLVRVTGPDGVPAKDVYPRVSSWDGVRLDVPGVQTRPTETAGEYEINAPEGTVGLQVGWDKPYGTATATVRSGETTNVEMKLRELPPK